MPRPIYTNMSKGELDPLIDGRPDLNAYGEGAISIENFLLLRQGGLTRRPGLRLVQEVKDSTKDVVLLPFEFSVDDTFMIEMGNIYARFFKNNISIRLSAGAPPFELTTPYLEAALRLIHFTQSADVLFLFNQDYQQRRLSRISDVNWQISAITHNPPPSFEADADISLGIATLTPGAKTGTGITFTASSGVFLASDVGRVIIYQASRATIKTFTDTSHVIADILDDFPSTVAIPAGQWFLHLSPQSSINAGASAPVGIAILITSGTATWRVADVGKFMIIYGGVVRIDRFDSATQVLGVILSAMSTSANPPAASPAGSWNLEEVSWSTSKGWPRTGEFFQGRLAQASTPTQKTTFWMSQSDSYDNFATGVKADDAVEYTIASRRINRIEWLADHQKLFLGTSGAELLAQGNKSQDEPIGGDTVPAVHRMTDEGCAPIQAFTMNGRVVFIDRSRRKLFVENFSWEQDTFIAEELTGGAPHIFSGNDDTLQISLGPIATTTRPHPRMYFVRSDGTLIAFTFFVVEKVVGFTRLTTNGKFRACAAIPQPAGAPDQVWVVVERTIDGVQKKFIEYFDEALETDSSVTYDGASTSVVTGLFHFEGLQVDVKGDGSYKGIHTVTGGSITLQEPCSHIEVGFHYESSVLTFRPTIPGTNVEGLMRNWNRIFVRMYKTRGGHVNGERLPYTKKQLTDINKFGVDLQASNIGWDQEGRVLVEQREPYDMNLLAIFGDIDFGG